MTTYDDVAALARTQHALLGRTQLSDMGASRDQIRSWIHSRHLERATARVLRIVGSPHTVEQDALLAVLDADGPAALARDTAAAWWGLPGFEVRPFHVVRAHRGSPRRRLIHQTRSLPPHHLAVARGVPVTSPERTLVDLAGCIGPRRLERAVDFALTRRLARMPTLFATVRELTERGRRGIPAIRAVIEARGVDYRPGDSLLELRFAEIASAAGLVGFEQQVDLHDEQGWIGRVDVLHRASGVVIEIDGDAFHTSMVDRRHDEQRDARLRAAGYLVVRLPATTIVADRGRVVEQVRAAVARRLAPAS